MKLLIGWIVNAIALYVAVALVPGIAVSSWQILILAAAVIGIVNTFIKPIVQIVSLPITVLTIGIFALIINAAMLGLSAWLVPGFTVVGFWSAFLGAIILSLVSTVLHTLLEPKPVY